MSGIIDKEPIEWTVMIPFALLREFTAHEQELLARMRPHETEIAAQIGETLPTVTGHLADERAFAVDHLVMGERQDKVFGKRVEQAKGEVIVVILAMDGLLRHVAMGIVHPTLVPLIGKAKSARRDRATDAGPGVRFFRDRNRTRTAFGDDRIEVAEKADRFEIVAAAI